MLLYHGSNISVREPKILHSDRRLDFGTGFYLTSNYEQAERWAHLTTLRRCNGKPVVSVFDFEEKKLDPLKILHFNSASEEWLEYVSRNRNTEFVSDTYDVVIGPVANDRTMPVLKRFFSGIYTKEEALRRLIPQKLSDQYAFKTEKALSILKFKEEKYYETGNE